MEHEPHKTDTANRMDLMAHADPTDPQKHLYNLALHRTVLVVYSHDTLTDEWAAYVTPVPGKNHEQEQHLYRTEGSKLREDQARALWPALAEMFDSQNVTWRR